MKLVLLQDVTHVGRKGETVSVANGYGINFLIPQRKAVKLDSPEGMRVSSLAQTSESNKAADKSAKADSLRSISGEQFTLPVEVNESGVLFASLNESKIAQMLSALSQVDLDSKDIKLADGIIKTVGEYNAILQSGSEKVGEIMLNVEAIS